VNIAVPLRGAMSSIRVCRAWKILKRLNGLHQQQTNIKFFLLLGKVLMETFQVVWNAYDEKIVFKVSEWHHITWTASDHQMVKVIAAKGGILEFWLFIAISSLVSVCGCSVSAHTLHQD
jgi:hypothetical protein